MVPNPEIEKDLSIGSLGLPKFFLGGVDVSFIEDNYQSSRLIKVVDILGRKSIEKQNSLLFYIYADGIVEKKTTLI